MRFFLLIQLLSVAALCASGCQSGPTAAERIALERRGTIRQRRAASHRAARLETRAVAVNRHLIYTPRWTRAEDLAATLDPLLQNMYGPSAMAYPHTASNKLFIYVPDERDRQQAGTGARGGARPATRVPGAPAVSTRSGTRTGRPARSTSSRR